MCMKQGAALPPAIANAPTLDDGLEIFYAAFLELESTRQIGMAMGPIPRWAITIYCSEYGFDADLRQDMYDLVGLLDRTYMEHANKESKRKGKH